MLTQTNTDGWAKAGVMIRQDLTGGAPNACMVLDPNANAQMQYRTTAAGASSNVYQGGVAVPNWVKLTRVGIFERFGEKRFFATIEEAVKGYLAKGQTTSIS